MRYHFMLVISLVFFLSLIENRLVAAEINSEVFRVMLSKCGLKEKGFVQTGFRAQWNGQHGIVTALHGVSWCNNYIATQGQVINLTDLTLVGVDVDRDVAFLSSKQLASIPGTPLLKAKYNTAQDQLKVIGYPDGVLSQISNKLRYHDNPLRRLGSWHKRVTDMCEQRKSPACDISVLLVAEEPLIPGHSGAPVFNQHNHVIGIADGGVKGGFALLNWIIPYEDVRLVPANQQASFLNFLKKQDLTKLFASVSTIDKNKYPTGHGATISGKVLYGGYSGSPIGIAANYSKAYAVIQLWDSETRKEVPVNFTYDNHTGRYTINNVPTGKFHISIRLESGYPFYKTSAGDFISYLSGLNEDIIVAPHDKDIYRDLKVVYSINLKRPVNNQEERTSVGDAKEILYKQNFYPSASVFEWDRVPAADQYEVWILLMDVITGQRLDVKNFSTTQTIVSPNLDVNSGNTYYMFRVAAKNNKGGLIGHFSNYYKNGFGGWFEFRVLQRPY
jgi:hypothetical protein